MKIKAPLIADLDFALSNFSPISLYHSYTGNFPSSFEISLFQTPEELLKFFKGEVLATQAFNTRESKNHIESAFIKIEDNIFVVLDQKNHLPEKNTSSDQPSNFFVNDNDDDDDDSKFPTFSTLVFLFENMTLEELQKKDFFIKLKPFVTVPDDFQANRKPYAHVITTDPNGKFNLTPFSLQPTKIDIGLNYGEPFVKLHEYIVSNLTDDERIKGLYLFHGFPGTGKSSYIRYLINFICKKKRVIYLSPDFASSLTDAGFLTFLLKYPNSVLVIEDGENILKKRNGASSQAVANLLNLSDGLLSDLLKIQVICTFNCDMRDIDEALLRKGRLVAKHEFKALEIDQAQDLLDSMNIDFKADKKMTLADIYNVSDLSFEKGVSTKIGF